MSDQAQIAAARLRDWRKLGQGLHARYVGSGFVDLKLLTTDAVCRDENGVEWVTTDDHPPPRQRFHIDVEVPGEVAESRIAAALAAGGVIVDQPGPSITVIADQDGDRACVGFYDLPAAPAG